MKYNSITALVRAGFSDADAIALRRISMTLQRWHELECGDGNSYASWTIARGRKTKTREHTPQCAIMNHWESLDHGPCNCQGPIVRGFEYDDDGKPFLETHPNKGPTEYRAIPDREKGARKRLAAILARYPGFRSYIQGDPRGAALYILRPDDLPMGADIDCTYSNGIAVYK